MKPKIIKHFLSYWWDSTNRWLIISLLFLILFVFVTEFIAPLLRPKSEKISENDHFVDTLIPENHVLIPIELQNQESLESLIGEFAIIDLFIASSGQQGLPYKYLNKGLKVGNKLKLLRAPLNPHQFAVLVHENEAQMILSHTGPFIAAINNRKEVNREKKIKNEPTTKESSSIPSKHSPNNKKSQIHIEYYQNEVEDE